MRAELVTTIEKKEKGQEMAETERNPEIAEIEGNPEIAETERNLETGEVSAEKETKEKIGTSVETGAREEIGITMGDHQAGNAPLTGEAPDVILGMIGVKIGGVLDLTVEEEDKAEGMGHTVIEM